MRRGIIDSRFTQYHSGDRGKRGSQSLPHYFAGWSEVEHCLAFPHYLQAGLRLRLMRSSAKSTLMAGEASARTNVRVQGLGGLGFLGLPSPQPETARTNARDFPPRPDFIRPALSESLRHRCSSEHSYPPPPLIHARARSPTHVSVFFNAVAVELWWTEEERANVSTRGEGGRGWHALFL